MQDIVDHWHAMSPVPPYAPEWLELSEQLDPPAETGRLERRPACWSRQ